MINYKCSDSASVTTVVVPELSGILSSPAEIERRLTNAFSYANPSKYRQILLMKKHLGDILNSNIPDALTPEMFASAYETVCEAAKRDFPDHFTAVLPGLISPPPYLMTENWNGRSAEILSALSGSATFFYNCHNSKTFARSVINSSVSSPCDIAFITGRYITPDTAELLIRLIECGKSVTLCCSRSATLTLSAFAIHGSDRICVYDGHILIPGKSLLTLAPPFPITEHTSDSLYKMIGAPVSEIIQKEVGRRFALSSKGKPYYKTITDTDIPPQWGLFYDRCLGSFNDPHIRGVLTGGALYDTVSITPDLSLIPKDRTDIIGRILRCTVAACRNVHSRFPLRSIPYYKDSRVICGIDELVSAVRSHLDAISGLCGDFSLRIIPDDKFSYPSADKFASVISGFFGLGGIMITFMPKGETNETLCSHNRKDLYSRVER